MVCRLQPGSNSTSRVCWHPDGRAFAVVSVAREVIVISSSSWVKQKTFAGGHNGDITAIGWSPNGAFFTSAGTDGQIVLWEAATQSVIKRYLIPSVINFAWHPTENVLAFVTTDGELFIYNGFVPPERVLYIDTTSVSAPLLEGRSSPNDEHAGAVMGKHGRLGSSDLADNILNYVSMDGGEDDFGDDYGSGAYTDARRKKRPVEDDMHAHASKRRSGLLWESQRHHPFQPGSTPWSGDRRYLCGLNVCPHNMWKDIETDYEQA
ncbi:hypothetical protein KEM55_000086 [Ascosphaera atra]|nr:hypothetical protein KEM55_000086 [Ascosphaera atra]